MHNLYQILGVNKDASKFDIKNAYRKKLLSEHHDKGDNDQRMVLLNEVMEILSNPIKREKFDKEWEVYAYLHPTRPVRPSGCLPTAGIAFSQSFRHQHAQFVNQSKSLWEVPQTSLALSYLKSYNSHVYSCPENVANDIFSFLKTKLNIDSKLDLKPLTPERAVEYFINFLQGDYFGNNLKELSRSFYQKIKQLENSEQQTGSEFKLYCGIYEIFLVAVKEKTPSLDILDSLNKITEYSKHNTQTMSFMAPLFQSKYFRCLFLQALHFYWRNGRILDKTSFDGRVAAEHLFERLKSRLSEIASAGTSTDRVFKLLQRLRLLFTLEQDLFKSTDEIEDKLAADFYREKAFHLLDWLPSLMGFADRAIVNTLLQIGIALLTAARRELDPTLSRADEKLATHIYVKAVCIARHETPDVEIYACVHSVKCLLSCRYADSEFKEILEGLQNRALWLADLFPFFQSPQSNADFMEKEDNLLDLMRSLLHALVDKVDCLNGPSEIDHRYVRVIYQAYEACLKNWYQDDHDAEKESNFRQRLMKELLASKQWTVDDINYNLNTPWALTDLDEEGWTCPNKSSILSLAKKSKAPTYKTIHGAEFNYKTGEINIILDYCADNENNYNRLLTPSDLNELFQRRFISAVFNLETVDPDMPYHPFNNMRFKPSTLYHSQLLHTMFITDYLLKFLTLGQEVQRVYPYDLRSVDKIATSLPDHLKKIIYDVHASNHEKSLNRFWIESEEVELAVDEGKDDNVLFALGDIRMVVKHHKMKRDAEGKLVDTEGEDEGWDCYILTEGQKAELFNGKRIITDSVLIIIRESLDLIFWENQKATHCFTLEDDKDLVSLDKLQCDSKGKVKIDNSASLRQMYRLVRKAAEKMGMPHQYSPEFVFAQEFTKHYNEFAIYFPEFGRLRELSKAVTLVNVMECQHITNKNEIDLIRSRLQYKETYGIQCKLPGLAEEHEYWQTISQKFERIVRQTLNKQFGEWRVKFSEEIIEEKKRELLKDLKRQIGTLKFTSTSPEVKEICDKYYSDIKKNVIDELGYSEWRDFDCKASESIESKIPSIISDLEVQKKEACFKQLFKLFKDELDDLSRLTDSQLVNEFLEGNDKPLLGYLVYCDREKIAMQVKEVFPEHSINILDKALNNYPFAINEVVESETGKILAKHEKQMRKVLEGREKLEESFTDLGFGVDAEEVNLEGTCLWVPAIFQHDVERGRSRSVYGSVCITGMISKCIGENSSRLVRALEKRERVKVNCLRGNALNKM